MAATLADTSSLLSLFAEPTRVRLFALLAKEELSVAELTQVTELAQSRVSTHLGKLREAGVISDRRQGASTFYRASHAMPEAARAVWALLEGKLDDRVLDTDRERCQALIDAREAAWPEAVAGQMERHYSPSRISPSSPRAVASQVRPGE